MDVYVESNFVLELALLQEQYESCEKILALAEAGEIKLILPAYSLIEPYETLSRYARNRNRLSNELGTELKQLSRSEPYRESVDMLQKVTGFLVRSQEEEKTRLRSTLGRLLATAEIIPLTSEILASATAYQSDHDLSPQDSIVYGSVLGHLRASVAPTKCFLNRNSKDFDDPDIVDTLASHNCKVIFTFEAGHRYISSQIAPNPVTN